MALFSSPGANGPRRRAEPASLSIVATDLQVTGDLDADGVVKIEGHVRGNVRALAQVLVAAGATVEGDLVTREAVIGGVVLGAVEAGERVELLPTAVVTGNVVTARLMIHEGGRLNGEVAMRPVADSPPEEVAVPREEISSRP
jgi:cytoskeletal protein CcmA (bactofilin family)